MRMLMRAALVLAVCPILACSQTPVQPDAMNVASVAGSSSAIKPEIDPTWANGELVYMIGPKIIPNARQTMPNAYEHAEELYLVVFPQATTPAPGAGPITLPSGYQPQCNPCFHPGLPPTFVYHDHVITGAPGMGNNGTAGDYKAPWKIILLMYDPHYASSPNFRPLTSESAIDAAEQTTGILLPFNQGASNPFEVDTGNLLICPTVSKHA